MSRSHNHKKFFEAKRRIEEVLLANPQWATTRVEADIRQLAQLYQSINRILTNKFRIYVRIHDDEVFWLQFSMEVMYQEKSGKSGGIHVDFDSNYGDFIGDLILNFGHFVRKKDDIVAIMKVALGSKLNEIETKSLQALEKYKKSAEFRSRLDDARDHKLNELRKVLKSLDLLGCNEGDILMTWRETQVQKVMDT